MSIITLTTDYGLKDHFVGAIKGKILMEFPEATIIDISNNIEAFNITQASYIIGAAHTSFPKGTVHIIGVDIEMTKENKHHIAMQWNDQFFICADNGILSILIQKIVPQQIFAINIHDRLHLNATEMDVFIKVACHLAKGGLLNVIGKEIEKLKETTELQAVASENQIKGYIIHIDHFGNAISNISKKIFLENSRNRPYEVKIKNKTIKTIVAKYSDIATNEKYSLKDYEGEKLAIFNEAEFLEIALYRSNPESVGSAKTLLGLQYRDVVTIEFK